VDHCFSFPKAWLHARRLASWDAFLARFLAEWPMDREPVARCRPRGAYTRERDRLRLCERWTSSAKSVFQFPGFAVRETLDGRRSGRVDRIRAPP
jgi:hypothetical protein